jgi:hypothetical protein
MADDFKVKINFNRLPELAQKSPALADRMIEALAREGERYIKQSFGTSPSAAGDPPGVDTGALRSSIHVEDRGKMARAIADGVEYGVHLEYGTTKMAARPFMAPAAQWLESQVEKTFKGFLE